MFTMVEVVGVSPDSISKAVSNALTTLRNNGTHPSWFEIIEQRGAIVNNEVSEFQVKLKVGVPVAGSQTGSAKPSSKETETCPTCNKPAGPDGHLCSPKPQDESTCDWCGAQIADQRHMCDEKSGRLAYICNSCGRAAVQPDQVCDPKEIKK